MKGLIAIPLENLQRRSEILSSDLSSIRFSALHLLIVAELLELSYEI